MVCPNKAKTTITPKATAAACQASLCRVRADRPRVRPRNSGTVPAGSMITSRVTKTSVKNFTARTISACLFNQAEAAVSRTTGAAALWTQSGGLGVAFGSAGSGGDGQGQDRGATAEPARAGAG